jgi:hypothetical protein
MTDAGTAGGGRPLQIVFSLMHAGYLRHYGEPLRLLAERGHRIHLALAQPDKDPADTAFVERLAGLGSQVTVAYGPERGYVDGWRRIAWLVRGLTDLARYADPRYADAWALRERMHEKVVGRVRSSAMEPLSKRVVTRFAARVAAARGEEEARRYGRLLARFERAVPPSRRHVRLLRGLRPDVVVASPVVEVASPQVEFVKAARALGIPSGVAVASWDNLTNKGVIRVIPDRVLVWNEIQLREATEMHGVAPEQVVVTGAQRFDAWFGREPSTTREAFAAKVGLPPERPFVLYLGSSPFIAPDEVSFVRRWLDALRASGRPALAEAGVLVRPHPQNAAQWRGFEAPPGVAVWPREGAQPDSGQARDDFYDSLSHAAAVVGVNTSALIESGIVGKSVFTLLDPQFAGTQEGTLHFHYLLEENGGFLHVARSVDEHLEQLDAGVRGTSGDAARNRRFAESFVRPHGLDRPAAPIVAEAILDLAALGPREPERPGAGTRLLRAALLPFVAGNAAVAALVLLAQRVRGRRPHALDEDA